MKAHAQPTSALPMLPPGTRLAGVLLLAACSLPFAGAQTPGGVQVKLGGGFSANIGDGNRLVARVSGREATPLGSQGAMRITGFKLETYRDTPNREVELLVESPDGVFDQRAGASSSKSLTLRSADQRFAITGDGWSWNRTTGDLVISNRVEATLQRPDPAATSGQPASRAPVTVQAARLDYNLKTGDTRFSGGSTATEPDRARVTAQEITTRLSPSDSKPDSIAGTGGVTIELLRAGRTGKVSGSTARYEALATGESIAVEGPATWDLGATTGSADFLELQPGAEIYAARGNARVRLALAPTKPAAPGNADAAQTRAPVELSADLVDARPGSIAFRGHVFARQTNKVELQATELIAVLGDARDGGTDRDRLREATASGEVIARILSTSQPMEVRGDRLTYRLADAPRLEMTGQPSWSAGQALGRAARLILLPEQPEFQAEEGVMVEWRGATAARRAAIQLHAHSMTATPSRVRFAGGVQAGREGWDLRAPGVELHLGTNGTVQSLHSMGAVDLDYQVQRRAPGTNTPSRGPFAALVRDVSAEASRWKIHAQSMVATLQPETQDIARLDAEGQVAIDQLAVRARAGRLAYEAADGLLRLSDHATVRSADGLEIVGEPGTGLIFDPRTARFQIDGALSKPMRLPMRSFRAPGPAPLPSIHP